MELTKGLYKNISKSKIPQGHWNDARNIVVSQKDRNVTVEEGFNLLHTINGVLIGRIETNTKVILFIQDSTFGEIYLLKELNVLTLILRSDRLNFNIDNPIERQKIKIYAEKDSDDALKLYDLFIPAFFYLTQHVPKSFQEIGCSATGSQINSFLIRSYLQVGHSIPKADEIQHFEGAISLGIPGIHKNVVSLDVQSLYPSLILQYSIYPKNKDPHGNFLKMVEYFTNERIKNKKLHKETKDDHYKDLSNTFKIFINSAYGLLGANGLNFNSAFDANKVTRLGRETLKKGIEHITGIPFDDWKTQNFKEDLEEKEEPELL